MRMKKNPFYTAPEAEFLVVRFEENLLVSGGAGGDDTIIDDDDDYSNFGYDYEKEIIYLVRYCRSFRFGRVPERNQ